MRGIHAMFHNFLFTVVFPQQISGILSAPEARNVSFGMFPESQTIFSANKSRAYLLPAYSLSNQQISGFNILN